MIEVVYFSTEINPENGLLFDRAQHPGNDKPASPTGTKNDAGYIPILPGANMVRSYLIPSPDARKYTDITVNYTIAGEHKLNQGFVVRFGEIGADGSVTLRSYGEGNSWRQGGVWKAWRSPKR